MKMRLDFQPFLKVAAEINKQSVVVGILDSSVKAASADYDKPITTLSTLSGSTKRRFVKKKGRNKNKPLQVIAGYLNDQKGIFEAKVVFANAKNQDLIDIAELFAKLDKTPRDRKRLENIARALVRNPIIRKDYNPNKPSTIYGFKVKNKDGSMTKIGNGKGFNHWGFSTGTMFKNIKAVYYKK